MPQSRSKALVLGIPRALPNIKPVDEQSIADVGRIISSVKTVVAHQHVQAVNTPREKCNALPGARERLAVRAAGSFDRGHRRWHPTPTRPPSVSRIEALDQHRARLTVDSDPRLPVYRSKRKTR